MRQAFATACLVPLMLACCKTQSARPSDYLSMVALIETQYSSGSGAPIWCEKNSDNTYTVYVLTCSHVAGSNQNYTIEGFTGGELIKSDSESDLALLRFQSDRYVDCFSFQVDELQPLARVLALGCPLGLDPIATEGLYSRTTEGTMFLSSPIIYGNSGGPLVNPETGQIVGVITAVASYSDGTADHVVCHLSMAAPVSTILDFLKDQPWQPSTN